MTVEAAGYITDVDPTQPPGTDNFSEGDNHLRNFKKSVQDSLPAISGPVTATHTELNVLDGVTSTTAELNVLDGVTSTAAEINILDGVTSTTAELNILDGVTSTFTELNLLDGVTSTTAELNILDGVTSTTAELNYVDGVTSAIQTQMNLKAALASPALTGNPTAPTQSADDNSTKIATTAYVDTAVQAFRGALVYQGSSSSIANNTLVYPTWDTESYDTSSIHHASTNTERLTVPSGVTKIRLAGGAGFASSSTGYRVLQFTKNASEGALLPQTNQDATSTGTTGLSLSSPVITVTSGDYFRMGVVQTSGGALNLNGGLVGTYFSMEIIE